MKEPVSPVKRRKREVEKTSKCSILSNTGQQARLQTCHFAGMLMVFSGFRESAADRKPGWRLSMSSQQVQLTPGWNDTHSLQLCILGTAWQTDVCLGFTSNGFNTDNTTSVPIKGTNEKHGDLTSCRRRWEGPQNSPGPSTVVPTGRGTPVCPSSFLFIYPY